MKARAALLWEQPSKWQVEGFGSAYNAAGIKQGDLVIVMGSDGIGINAVQGAALAWPSEYFANRVFGCFIEDDFGLHNRDFIGVDQITFESDYPHQDSTWPNTEAYAAKAMAELTDGEIFKIVRGNAIELFGLDRDLNERGI
jgi:Amidohydrolase